MIYQNCEEYDEKLPLRASPYELFVGEIEQEEKMIPRFVYQAEIPEK